MQKLAVVAEQEHACRVLVQSPHRLHALHFARARPLAQRRRQQGVHTGPGRWLLGTFNACGLVQHHISQALVAPNAAVHLEVKTLGVKLGLPVAGGISLQVKGVFWIRHFHMTVLHQTRTNAARAKALRKQNIV